MTVVLILRGLPGSGKSTWAKQQGGLILSADDYHMEDGKYVYKRENAGLAHQGVLKRFCESVREQSGFRQGSIIVDNTNTRIEELAPYVRVAEAYGAIVVIHHFHCSFSASYANNIHGVSPNTIWKMANALQQPIPWPQTFHFAK